MILFQADPDSETGYGLKTKQNTEPAPKNLKLVKKRLFRIEKSLTQFKSNIQEFDTRMKENQNKANEFSIGRGEKKIHFL